MKVEDPRVEEISKMACQFAAGQPRSRYLDQVCAGDASLRTLVEQRIEALGAASGTDRQDSVKATVSSNHVGDLDKTRPPESSAAVDFQFPGATLKSFGDYELLEKIDQGGMGIVYRARQTSLNRIVAVKMILAGQFADEQEVQRFHAEAQAAGDLDHPGIVPVFDVGCDQGHHYFSMAFVEGQSLAALIKQGPLPPRKAAQLIQKVALAIQVAHDAGIVHRDLKPGNVLLDTHGEPRVTDFGLAKRVEGGDQLTRTGAVLGTPSYMPPEQACGDAISSSADVYSLGAILYATLTGVPPFEGDSQVATILKVLQDEPVAPRKKNRQIPRDLEAICLKCLEKEPADRYASAADVAADLHRFLAGEPIHGRLDWRRRFRKWSIREPVLASHLMATCVVLVMLVFNYWIWGDLGLGRVHNLSVLGFNTLILVGWALVVLVLQKVQNAWQTRMVLPLSWAAINPIFLTILLCWNDPPREWLVSAYYLLMTVTCFFRRVDLVVVSAAGSLLGYLVLVGLFFWPQGEPLSYILVLGLNLMVGAVMLGFLTLRLKRLGEQVSP